MIRDIIFLCDANADTGLGHGSRCAHLAKLILKKNPDLSLAFQGTFSSGARNFMSGVAPSIPFLLPDEKIHAGTVFVDRMAVYQDPEACPSDLISRLMKSCGRVIYMASGVTVPTLPEGAVCIGYQPSDIFSSRPNLFWGLEFAPTHSGLNEDATSGILREHRQALVAFGGGQIEPPVHLVLSALSLIGGITDIHLLNSPVNVLPTINFRPGIHQRLYQHENSEHLSMLLRGSGIVITSFGNLGYEALAAGAPLCLVGQNQFQVDFAERLEKIGLAVSAGLVGSLAIEETLTAICRTLEEAEKLSAMARQKIDGQGLNRIASIIVSRESNI